MRGLVRSGIPLCLDLRNGILGRPCTPELQLKDVNHLVGVDDDICPPLVVVHLRLDKLPQQGKDEV